MANRSYLCATNQYTTYPSVLEEGYDPSQQTIASDVWCVPLLWPALFRTADIVRKVLPTADDEPGVVLTFGHPEVAEDASEEELVTEAPIVPRLNALKQLQEALPYLNELFAEPGALDEYASFLVKALESASYEFITIEMDEIASLSEPKQMFHDEFRTILAGIGTDVSRTAKDRLVRLASLRNLRRFPPARLLLDSLPGDDDDFWNHCRILGAGSKESGVGRAVPWELEPIRTRYTPNAPHLVPVFVPKLEIVLSRHEERKGSPLTEEEVLSIRDNAVCMMVPAAHAARFQTGGTIDPANCWQAWCARKTQR